TKGEVLQDLRKYLLARHQRELTTMIVVDDAQDLSIKLLEEIRLLSNLETDEEKLLQILLVGQPELDEKLDSFKLRQLKQRIALRSHLEPLDLEETSGYIRHRLQLAGTPSEACNLFGEETIERVFHHSGRVAGRSGNECIRDRWLWERVDYSGERHDFAYVGDGGSRGHAAVYRDGDAHQ